ncbi:hypothetical protein Y032_0073g789 [Ancylostoma ceylanicum]|uniref:Uncharacterized protein n=1 Tax=Ancylostoma ceylanicum TaxID=53326 RepID=A0A016TVW1_9BILA|nr:hypothetical protein Y032_0073g789 [Ancylostoma ceylanicum]
MRRTLRNSTPTADENDSGACGAAARRPCLSRPWMGHRHRRALHIYTFYYDLSKAVIVFLPRHELARVINIFECLHKRSTNSVIRRVETLAALLLSCCHPPLIAAQADLLLPAVTEEWQQLGRQAAEFLFDALRCSDCVPAQIYQSSSY